MISVKSSALLIAFVMTVGLGAACSKTPTAPTPPPPPPPPPVANPPSLACVEGISRATVNAGGVAVSYDTPPVTDGQGSVMVTCSPSSGETFPIGTTEVTCTATDTLNRNGTCSFNVTVSKLAQLSRVRFLAFGDSITAGEVTSPVGGSIFIGLGVIHRQVIVPVGGLSGGFGEDPARPLFLAGSIDLGRESTVSAAKKSSLRATAISRRSTSFGRKSCCC